MYYCLTSRANKEVMKPRDFSEMVGLLKQHFLTSNVNMDDTPDPYVFEHYRAMQVIIVSEWLEYHTRVFSSDIENIGVSGVVTLAIDADPDEMIAGGIREHLPEMWGLLRGIMSSDKSEMIISMAWFNHQEHIRGDDFIPQWGENARLPYDAVDFISQNGIGEVFPELFE